MSLSSYRVILVVTVLGMSCGTTNTVDLTSSDAAHDVAPTEGVEETLDDARPPVDAESSPDDTPDVAEDGQDSSPESFQDQSPSPGKRFVVTQITENDQQDVGVEVSEDGSAAWVRYGAGVAPQVFLWSEGQAKQISTTGPDNFSVAISTGGVAWIAQGEVWLYDGEVTTQITQDGFPKTSLVMDGQDLWWSAFAGPSKRWQKELFRYHAGKVEPITSNGLINEAVDPCGARYAWVRKTGLTPNTGDIRWFDGQNTIMVTDDEFVDSTPRIAGEGLYWIRKTCHGSEGSVMAFQDGEATQITDAAVHCGGLRIHGDDAVFACYGNAYSVSFGGIYQTSGTGVIQVTSNVSPDVNPRIGEDGIAWEHMADEPRGLGMTGEVRFSAGPDIQRVAAFTYPMTSAFITPLRMAGRSLAWLHFDGNDTEVMMATIEDGEPQDVIGSAVNEPAFMSIDTQCNPPVLRELYGVHAVSANVAYASGEEDLPDFTRRGVVLRHDSGSWKEEVLPDVSPSWSLDSITLAEDGVEGWAVGASESMGTGVILHRTAAGWSVEESPVKGELWGLEGIDAGPGGAAWAAGWDYTEPADYRGVLLKRDVPTGAWIEVPAGVSAPFQFYGVSLSPDGTAWAVGDRGSDGALVMKCIETGCSESVLPVDHVARGLFAVDFPASDEGWVAGMDASGKKAMLHFKDGTWTDVTPAIDYPTRFFAIHFTSTKEGWAVGNDPAKALHRSDGAWSVADLPKFWDDAGPYYYTGVHFFDEGHGWAVGRSMELPDTPWVILRHVDGTWTYTPAKSQ